MRNVGITTGLHAAGGHATPCQAACRSSPCQSTLPRSPTEASHTGPAQPSVCFKLARFPMSDLPQLYLPKEEASGHPVAQFLKNQGIGYRDRSHLSPSEVSKETGIAEEQLADKLPLLKWMDGTRLENCDTDGLIDFLHGKGYQFEDS